MRVSSADDWLINALSDGSREVRNIIRSHQCDWPAWSIDVRHGKSSCTALYQPKLGSSAHAITNRKVDSRTLLTVPY